MADFFIKRPILSICLSVIIVQAGTQLGDRQQVIPLKPDSLTPQSKVVVDGLLQAEAASRNPAARLKAVPSSNQ